MHNILIDSEFQALIPPLSAEERAQLEANLLADGCRDPLVVWVQPAPEPGTHKCYAHDESKCDLVPEDDVWHCRHCEHNPAQQEYVLIDGHNRYEICTRLGIEYGIEEMLFDDRDAVIDWMEDNQLGRRNLKPDAFTYLLGRKYNRQKKSQGGDRGNQYVAKDQNDTLPTADKLAVQHGVSAPTVKRAGQFADAVEVINKAAPGFAAAVNAGEAPTRQEVVKAATVVAQIPEAAQNVALAAEFADLPNEAKQDAIEAIAQLAPAQEVMREAVKNHRAIGTGENEWYTPAEYVELAREVMGGIDLDPASCAQANEVVGAATFYTKEDDGLSKDWAGRLWLNPPYSRDLMPAFVEKLRASYMDGEVGQAVLVSHNNTDTAWFHSLAGIASAICFPKKRIRFYRDAEVAAPTNGQAFFYLGDDPQKFISTFESVGFVVRPA